MFKLINKMRKVKAFYYCFYAVWVTCVIGFVEKVLGYEHPLVGIPASLLGLETPHLILVGRKVYLL